MSDWDNAPNPSMPLRNGRPPIFQNLSLELAGTMETGRESLFSANATNRAIRIAAVQNQAALLAEYSFGEQEHQDEAE
jgi:hypothetical protein